MRSSTVDAGLVMALMGSLLAMLVVSWLSFLQYESQFTHIEFLGTQDVLIDLWKQAIVFPCACYLKMLKGRLTKLEVIALLFPKFHRLPFWNEVGKLLSMRLSTRPCRLQLADPSLLSASFALVSAHTQHSQIWWTRGSNLMGMALSYQ